MPLNIDSAVNFAEDTSGLFPGLCDHFVGRAYGLSNSGYESAWKHWNATPAKFRHRGSRKAPIGALVYWSNAVGDGYGHVAIVTGHDKDGMPIITSTHANGGRPTEFRLNTVMQGAYLGWAVPYFQGKTPDLDTFYRNVEGAKQSIGSEVDSGQVGSQTEGMYGLGTDQLKMGSLRKSWGIAAAVLKQNPELRDTLQYIINNGITDPGMQQRLLGETDWAKKHTATWMSVEKSRLEKDPAIWDSLVQTQALDIQKQFAQKGVQIDMKTARDYADKIIHGSGWNGDKFEIYDKSWLANTIADAVDFHINQQVDGLGLQDLTGEAADWSEKLNNAARDYGIDTNGQWFKEWFKRTMHGLIDGTLQESNINDDLIRQASILHPWAKADLERGITVRGAANPVMAAIADELELGDVSNMDINNNVVQQALNMRDEKGNLIVASPHEARLLARKSPEWQNTSRAKQEYTNIAQRIAADFGFLA